MNHPGLAVTEGAETSARGTRFRCIWWFREVVTKCPTWSFGPPNHHASVTDGARMATFPEPRILVIPGDSGSS